MYSERIIDHKTGKVTIRNYTPEEIEAVENSKKEFENLQKELNDKQLNRQSALAKLAALGLTEDEIAAL